MDEFTVESLIDMVEASEIALYEAMLTDDNDCRKFNLSSVSYYNKRLKEKLKCCL